MAIVLLNISNYVNPTNETHLSTTWEIATDETFTNIIYNITSVSDLIRHTPHITDVVNPDSPTIHARCKVTTNTGISDYIPASIMFVLRTFEFLDEIPTVLNPNDPPLISNSLGLMGDSRQLGLYTSWVIIRDHDNLKVWESLNNVNANPITVPPNVLEDGVLYTVYVNHNIIALTVTTIVTTPTLVVEGEPDIIPLTPTLTTGPFVVSLGTDTHLSTDWIIESTSGTLIWSAINDIVNLTTTTIPANTLVTGTSYVFKVRHNGNNVSSAYVSETHTTPSDIIAVPTLNVEGEPGNVLTSPILTTSVFTMTVGVDTHASTDWVIEDGASNIIWASLNDNVNLISINVPNAVLANSENYIFKVRHNGLLSSSSFNIESHTTIAPTIDNPVLTVSGEPNNIPMTPTLSTGSFNVSVGTDTHDSTDWVIESVGGAPVWSSIADTVNLLSIVIPTNTLINGITYVFKVRHNGVIGSSDYVSETHTLKPPVVVTPVLTVQGEPHNVVLSPTLTTAPFTLQSGIDTHVSTDWIIETTLGIVLWASIADTINKLTVTVPSGILTVNSTNYIFKARHNGVIVSSAYITETHTTIAPVINAPLLTVQGEPNNITLTPMLSTSVFNLQSGTDTHVSTDWLIETTSGAVVWSLLASTTSKLTVTVPNGTLSNGTDYIFKVRHNGSAASSAYTSEQHNISISNIWAPTTSYPTLIDGHTQTTLSNGKVLVVGGTVSNAPNSTCRLYDPITAAWSSVANYPTNISYHAASKLLDNRILVTGGIVTNIGQTGCSIYNPHTNSWTTVAPMGGVNTRTHSQSTVSTGNVLVINGRSTAGSRTQLYNPASNTWSTLSDDPHAAADSGQVTLSNGHVLVMYRNVWVGRIYNPYTNSWVGSTSSLPDIINARPTLSLLPDNKVLVVGDPVALGPSLAGNCLIYDMNNNTWSTAANYPLNILGHSQSTLLNNQVLVVGGYDLSGFKNYANIYNY